MDRPPGYFMRFSTKVGNSESEVLTTPLAEAEGILKCGEDGKCGEGGETEKVRGIIVPVSFCACLLFILTFWSLKLKNLHFFRSKNAKTFVYQSFEIILASPTYLSYTLRALHNPKILLFSRLPHVPLSPYSPSFFK